MNWFENHFEVWFNKILCEHKYKKTIYKNKDGDKCKKENKKMPKKTSKRNKKWMMDSIWIVCATGLISIHILMTVWQPGIPNCWYTSNDNDFWTCDLKRFLIFPLDPEKSVEIILTWSILQELKDMAALLLIVISLGYCKWNMVSFCQPESHYYNNDTLLSQVVAKL